MERDVLNYKQILLSLLPKLVKIDLLKVYLIKKIIPTL